LLRSTAKERIMGCHHTIILYRRLLRTAPASQHRDILIAAMGWADDPSESWFGPRSRRCCRKFARWCRYQLAKIVVTNPQG